MISDDLIEEAADAMHLSRISPGFAAKSEFDQFCHMLRAALQYLERNGVEITERA